MAAQIRIPLNVASEIVQMFECCYSEGIGPETAEILVWIRDNYPQFKNDYPWLPWEEL